MNGKVIDGRDESCPVKFLGMMIPMMPSMMLRLTGLFIRFKSDASKAGKVFKKELIRQGIDREIASELTDIYMESSHIRSYIQGLNYN
jgi:hypothetical protein